MTYSVPQSLQNANLTDIGCYIEINNENLSQEQIDSLTQAGYDFCPEEPMTTVMLQDIEKLDIPYDNILWNTSWYDEDTFNDLTHNLIKEAGHYLVFASGCRWNGASGYRFNDSLKECLSRPYECSITPLAVSAGGKTLVCRESSHDVPMGSLTYIIALTEAEYDRLSNTSDFRTIRKFAEIHGDPLLTKKKGA